MPGLAVWATEENSVKSNFFKCLAGLSLFAGLLPATPLVYLGTLTPGGGFVQESVVGFGNANCGLCGHGDLNTTDLLDFWRIDVVGSQLVTITGTRLDPNLDLAFVLYAGTLPEFPSALDSSVRDGKRIWEDGSPLGLTILAVGDDQLAFGGGACILSVPFCDPTITILLGTGSYTLAVSSGTGSGTPVETVPTNYEIVVDGIPSGTDEVVTPEPYTYLMMGTGLAALLAAARRRKAA
jgi:PEP-CTERM motif